MKTQTPTPSNDERPAEEQERKEQRQRWTADQSNLDKGDLGRETLGGNQGQIPSE